MENNQNKLTRSCSFCRKSEKEVGMLIASEYAAICEQCILHSCNLLFKDSKIAEGLEYQQSGIVKRISIQNTILTLMLVLTLVVVAVSSIFKT